MAQKPFAIEWDKQNERTYETGTKNGVIYPWNTSKNAYGDAVAWNGLSGVTETPSGAEATAIYADDMKYLNMYSAEELGLTIEAYTYPEEFEACDGSASLAPGVTIGQQARKTFAFCYKTTIGNDTQGNDFGYKLHIVYGCQAAPSERAYQTINDSPEAITFSWEISTTPVAVNAKSVDGAAMKVTSIVTIDSTKCDKTKLEALEQILYGSKEGEVVTPGKVLLPDEIAAHFAAA